MSIFFRLKFSQMWGFFFCCLVSISDFIIEIQFVPFHSRWRRSYWCQQDADPSKVPRASIFWPGSLGGCSRRRELHRPPDWGWCPNNQSKGSVTSLCSSPHHSTGTGHNKQDITTYLIHLSEWLWFSKPSSLPFSGQSQWRFPGLDPPCSGRWPSSSASLFSPLPEED